MSQLTDFSCWPNNASLCGLAERLTHQSVSHASFNTYQSDVLLLLLLLLASQPTQVLLLLLLMLPAVH